MPASVRVSCGCSSSPERFQSADPAGPCSGNLCAHPPAKEGPDVENSLPIHPGVRLPRRRLLQAQSPGQPSTRNGDWPHYTADIKGTRYSPLDQINATNFGKLEVAWRFKTDNLGPRPEYKLEGTPLAIKGILYTTGGTRRSVVALDGRTGEVIWTHSLREGKRAAVSPRQLSGRGVSYWTDGKGDERIIYVTTGYQLVAAECEDRRDDSVVRRRTASSI